MSQISATISDSTRESIKAIAQKNQRTFSQTVEMLLAFAVKEKTRLRKQKSGTDGLQ